MAASNSQPEVAAGSSTLPPLAVYVHFPWCARKCPYCDFASQLPPQAAGGSPAIDHEGYADAVIAEIEARAPLLTSRRLETVYFGGGTPSLWEPTELGRVLQRIFASVDGRVDHPEVTVECNPSSIDASRAAALRAEGVDRLSIGVQSLDADRLRFLERLHDPSEAVRAVEVALASGARVSADLIFSVAAGRGRGSPEEAAVEACALAALGVGHVSAYALTIEAGTPFGDRARRGRLPLVDEDAAAATFTAVAEALATEGLARYEVSSFARPGQRSRHNLAVWRGQDYLGLGCSAVGSVSSRDGSAQRYHNPRSPDRYLATVGRGALQAAEHEHLDADTRMAERIMLGLRTVEGVDVEAAAAELGVRPWPASRRRAAEAEVERGRLIRQGGHLRLSDAGWLFVDGIVASLM